MSIMDPKFERHFSLACSHFSHQQTFAQIYDAKVFFKHARYNFVLFEKYISEKAEPEHDHSTLLTTFKLVALNKGIKVNPLTYRVSDQGAGHYDL